MPFEGERWAIILYATGTGYEQTPALARVFLKELGYKLPLATFKEEKETQEQQKLAKRAVRGEEAGTHIADYKCIYIYTYQFDPLSWAFGIFASVLEVKVTTVRLLCEVPDEPGRHLPPKAKRKADAMKSDNGGCRSKRSVAKTSQASFCRNKKSEFVSADFVFACCFYRSKEAVLSTVRLYSDHWKTFLFAFATACARPVDTLLDLPEKLNLRGLSGKYLHCVAWKVLRDAGPLKTSPRSWADLWQALYRSGRRLKIRKMMNWTSIHLESRVLMRSDGASWLVYPCSFL